MKNVLELSEKGFKTWMIKMFQSGTMNIRLKPLKNRKPEQRNIKSQPPPKKRKKERPNGNFITEKYIKQNIKSQ